MTKKIINNHSTQSTKILVGIRDIKDIDSMTKYELTHFPERFANGKLLSKEEQNNKQFIMMAVKEHGLNLEYIPNEFKYDIEIVEQAIMNCYNDENMHHLLNNIIPKELFKNADFIYTISTEYQIHCLKYAHMDLKNNENFIKCLVKNNPKYPSCVYQYASKKLREQFFEQWFNENKNQKNTMLIKNMKENILKL
jgi:hypothetical protein